MILAKKWKGNDLKGKWQVTYKIDGVRCIVQNGIAYSKEGRVFDHFTPYKDGDYEVFANNWEDSISIVRGTLGYSESDFYSLDPLDPRLFAGEFTDPTAGHIEGMLAMAVKDGYEGLILRQEDKWLKVKPVETYDVEITGLVEGQGKHKGRLGAFVTPMGNVGTGLTDAERDQFWASRQSLLHTVIEVECMQLTKEKQFRHPRFKRLRPDKE